MANRNSQYIWCPQGHVNEVKDGKPRLPHENPHNLSILSSQCSTCQKDHSRFFEPRRVEKLIDAFDWGQP